MRRSPSPKKLFEQIAVYVYIFVVVLDQNLAKKKLDQLSLTLKQTFALGMDTRNVVSIKVSKVTMLGKVFKFSIVVMVILSGWLRSRT